MVNGNHYEGKPLGEVAAPKLLAKTAGEKLKDSTIHGCGMFFRSEHWIIRIIWICFGLGALGYLIYLMTTSIIEYNKHEVSKSGNIKTV